MFSKTLVLSLLPISALAHYKLTFPPGRGFDESGIVNFPCGGFNTPSNNRTSVPLTGTFPIQLSMEHTSVKGAVFMALGNNPQSAFSIPLRNTFQETGPDNFCIGGVTIPSNLNITEGTNATIQVVTNGDPNGGLYQCADVTFTNTALSSSDYNAHCTNSTGVSANFIANTLPNGTASTTGTSGSGTATASATSKAWAAQKTVAPYLLGAMGLIGSLAAL
ncbi:gpi anchored protein [Venturia nashicola]|uniref:Gpi anchored protein n=1 Tax=Venturia nashicola TaxID=86259 RepID=A0A4Z1NTC0_9PEZI|nr:gpi anchored protein [Venturia nashicola]TLD29936.1 gpi anchored protein [Venturia nashicola]